MIGILWTLAKIAALGYVFYYFLAWLGEGLESPDELWDRTQAEQKLEQDEECPKTLQRFKP